MGFLAQALTQPAVKSASMIDLIRDAFAGARSSSGKAVNHRTALQVSTVFAANRVIANGIAQVPLKLMREDKTGRHPAKEHSLYKLMALRPNSWQTSFEFRQMVSWHAEMCGNAYVFKNRSSRGQILELIPFLPSQVTVKQADDYTLTYDVTAANGSKMTFPAETIWHVRGPTWDGVNGLEVVKIARNAIGLAMAAEEAVAGLHKNGARPSGVYSVDGTLSTAQYKDLSEWVNSQISGSENAGKPLILDRAAKWLSTQMTSIDAQSQETRAQQIEEVCAFYGIMPIMVGHSDKAATYASAAEMFLAHVKNCLSPRWEQYEQSMAVNLLTEKELDDGLYFNFVEEGMLRGSVKDTHAMILADVNGGIITPNQGRAMLDMNPDTDPASDKLRIPANIVGAVPDAKPQGTP